MVPTRGAQTSATITLRVIVRRPGLSTVLQVWSDRCPIQLHEERESSPQLPQILQSSFPHFGTSLASPQLKFNGMASSWENNDHVSSLLEPVTGVTVVTSDSAPLEHLDTIALSCVASGTVQTRTWFKDNQTIRENSRIFTSPDKAKLIIISVYRNDAGTYKCIASNSFSSGSGETYVQVYSKTAAIVRIVIGFLVVGLIAGVSGWLIARKTGGIKDPPELKHDTSIKSGRTSTLDTHTANASQDYQNFLRNEQGTRDNADDGNSTYMGLVLEDRSVYSDLKR
ncbi:carcinoembryonic antigen-related cell adhesion molecule 1-like [Mobula hypostoma]